MSKPRRASHTATYFEQVKAALSHYTEWDWLGEHSPLAAPYFLGAALHGAPPTANGRGQTLWRAINHALETLWGGPLPTDAPTMLAAVAEERAAQGSGDRYYCLILELNYCRRCFHPPPKSQAEIYNDILHISRPSHDRHLAEAVERLGTVLLQRLRPTLRPEQPLAPPPLIGRAAIQAQVLDDLLAGKSVSLAGPGGVGKTSLAAALADQWTSPAVFWFTLRPTFNDQLESLIFALGHFLHEQGASLLWHQLVANGGRIQQINLAVGLAQADLAAAQRRPLLCFDELDFLRPLTPEQANPQHVQLREFIDALRAHAPMLLIGQRVDWESDHLYLLDGLSLAQVGALLTNLALSATAEEQAQLHDYTAGNPRLIELCAALYHANAQTSLGALLAELPQAPALLPLWRRLERRLPASERRLLSILAVFRAPAPADAWGADDLVEPAALAGLLQRRLLWQDGQGGVTVLPALRQVIYDDLAVEVREQSHLQAAQIRIERGEYTAAAYHLLHADQPEAAVGVWYAHRGGEINRGQASAALALFAQVSLRRLSAKRQTELRLLRGELYQLTGQPERTVETLAGLTLSADAAERVDVAWLLGAALDQQGQADGALAAYADGLAVANGLLSKMAQLHTGRALIYLHERNLQQAWQEANRARYLAENMVGSLHEQSGQLDAAHTHYAAALAVAQAASDHANIARSCHNLGNLASRRLQLEAAIGWYQRAMESHQAIGDRSGLEFARSGLVTTFMHAARYAEALEPARQALRFFQSIGNSFWVALNASNLAEAYTELGDLAAAEEHAQLVLDQEEPHSHPYALFTLGRVREQQAQLAAAAQYLQQARRVAEQNGDHYLAAYAWEALGKLHHSLGQPEAARTALTEAQHQFQALKIDQKAQEVTQALIELDASQPKSDA